MSTESVKKWRGAFENASDPGELSSPRGDQQQSLKGHRGGIGISAAVQQLISVDFSESGRAHPDLIQSSSSPLPPSNCFCLFINSALSTKIQTNGPRLCRGGRLSASAAARAGTELDRNTGEACSVLPAAAAFFPPSSFVSPPCV